LRPFKDDLSKTVLWLFYKVPQTNPDGPATVFTDRFWDDREHWIPPGVGVVPFSMKPYFGNIPPPNVGVLSGTPDEWINGLLYSKYVAGGYTNPNGCVVVRPVVKITRLKQAERIFIGRHRAIALNQAQTVIVGHVGPPATLHQSQQLYALATVPQGLRQTQQLTLVGRSLPFLRQSQRLLMQGGVPRLLKQSQQLVIIPGPVNVLAQLQRVRI
jgi:hypothetical protein